MSVAQHPQLHLRLQAWRSRVLLLLVLAWFVALAGRAFYLQGLHHGFLQQKGESRYSRVIEISATRGMIVDRNNEPLAISTPVESVAASPADIEATPAQVGRLARLLETDAAELARKLSDPGKYLEIVIAQRPILTHTQ